MDICGFKVIKKTMGYNQPSSKGVISQLMVFYGRKRKNKQTWGLGLGFVSKPFKKNREAVDIFGKKSSPCYRFVTNSSNNFGLQTTTQSYMC